MPLAKLYVEGDLDAAIYNTIFSGITIAQGGSKNSLSPQARRDRTSTESKLNSGYLRDRDFDFEPTNSLNSPTVDAEHDGQVFGWRLNRHEIENYLVDPRVVCSTFGIEAADWEITLSQAAVKISHYQAARWTIGYVRSNLPPNYKLNTIPDGIDELRLPPDLSEAASLRWCKDAIEGFRNQIEPHLAVAAIEAEITRRRGSFSVASLNNCEHVLAWCSGKDLIAAVDLVATGDTRLRGPKDLCNRLRDWVMKNPESFLSFFPELQEIRKQLLN